MPMPSTHTSVSAGSTRRRWSLARWPGARPLQRRVDEQRAEGDDDGEHVEQPEDLVAGRDVEDGEHGGER